MVAENEFWIEDPEVVRLFPTFVWKCRFRPEVHRPINGSLPGSYGACFRTASPFDRAQP